MYCDFATVTDILYQQIVTSSINNYNSFLNMLFSSYLTDSGLVSFDRAETSKLHHATRIVSANFSEYYLKVERSVMLGDITELLKYLFDKEKLHKSLYYLILNDDLLSAEYRKSIISRFQPDFTDDSALSEIICEALHVAILRPYVKNASGYTVKSYFNPDFPEDKLFSRRLPEPCRYFSDRDRELEEFHALIQNETKVIVTGVAGIGKSEFIRVYVQKYKSEYAHIGYYFIMIICKWWLRICTKIR